MFRNTNGSGGQLTRPAHTDTDSKQSLSRRPTTSSFAGEMTEQRSISDVDLTPSRRNLDHATHVASVAVPLFTGCCENRKTCIIGPGIPSRICAANYAALRFPALAFCRRLSIDGRGAGFDKCYRVTGADFPLFPGRLLSYGRTLFGDIRMTLRR